MAKAHIYTLPGANVEVTDTFATWIDTTNALVYDMGTVVMTSVTQPQPNTSVGGYTVGNSHLEGILSANTLVASNGLRGGTVSTSGDLSIVSSTIFSESPLVRITANTENFTVNANNTTFTGNTVVISSTTDATSSTSAPLKTNGGLAVAKKLYVGGQTFASANVNITGSNSLITPNLVANNVQVTGTGTFNNLNVTGNAIFNSDAQLAVNNAIVTHSTVTDDITLTNATIIGDLDPDVNNTYDIGTTSLKWKTLYANNVVANVDWSNITSKPDPVITVSLSGDVIGSANGTLTDLTDGSISIVTTIQPNSVALGTDTTGNYVGTITAGTSAAQTGTSGLTISAAAGEGTAATIAHANTSTVANLTVDQSNGIVLQDLALTFDTFGHVTGATAASTNLDLRYVQTAFQNIAVSGQSTVISDSLSDTLTLAGAGTVSITTNATTDTITITGDATNLSVTAGSTSGPTILSSTGTGVVLPTASNTASGVITTGAQTFAGSKTFTSTISGSVNGNAATADTINTTLPVLKGGTGQTSYTDGQLLIGSTSSGSLVKANLTAGLNMSVTNGSGSISIAANPSLSYTSSSASGTVDITGSGTSATIPAATASIAGLLTAGTQTIAGAKTFINSLTLSNTTPALVFEETDNAAYGTTLRSSAGSFEFLNASGSVVLFLTQAGALTADSNITAYSDARLKENVTTIDSALDKVSQMRGVYYNRIDDETKTRNVGVIAQEIEKVLPEVVHNHENDIKSVAYGNIVGILIEAIKELNEEVRSLRSELESK